MTSHAHHSRSTASLHGDGYGERHHRSSGRDSKHKSLSKKSSTATYSSQFSTEPVSFLFSVIEYHVSYGNSPAPRDQWDNTLPPLTRNGYRLNNEAPVFRYRDGIVSEAPEYAWRRLVEGQPGGIYRHDEHGQFLGQAFHYKAHSIFACSPCLPFIIADGDISLYNSYMRNVGDHGTNTYVEDSARCWHMLHFDHNNGISQANGESYGHPWVAGRNPSWMPSLVPKVFRNHKEPQTLSRGLSGEISIVIGLMAFHSPPRYPGWVFEQQWWTHNLWQGPNSAPVYYPPQADAIPRGFLVHVCLDLYQAPGVSPEHYSEHYANQTASISEFEADRAWVRDVGTH
ncbi:hypothetical protein NEUTE1DRAFT_98611 [Neurospora tetrasperma FGSC 2508]|uniref:Uncharacterized protein n=1 Tax=Neurospora tetrasperma (strain FGSC 2508 / ATCC MYA-4615 / P0657) TaxID=510951 RepID=F8MDS2_NEUT8|nr:uncharacterized protein NEUTE1DRAFT_98611 [Neurospora tetrasperma FGSC 2508]EGO61510.1 hypothetical protein NEUTE1DRAFT_98611 [Neurospora tetrasperma FGSC 2508]EGZ74454.1 hypothetical protein NEUTE2DRAFT_163476 [Neurospora tetrasperma FGSC 2509]